MKFFVRLFVVFVFFFSDSIYMPPIKNEHHFIAAANGLGNVWDYVFRAGTELRMIVYLLLR